MNFGRPFLPRFMVKERFFWVFSLIILLLPFSRFAAGAEAISSPPSAILIDPTLQFGFAEHCFASGDYVNAISEYKRFVYFFPKDDRVGSALYQTGISYFKIGRFSDAIQTFERVMGQFPDTPFFEKSHFMISQCQKGLNEFGLAVNTLHNLIVVTKDVAIKDKAYFETGWLYLETPRHAGAFDEARHCFSLISDENREKFNILEMLQRLDRIETGKDKIPEKNPTLARYLSIIPGLGQAYCGRYQDALISFVLNSGLILAACEAFDDRNNALGGVIAFVELGFYAGNIYGATTDAHKYNRTQRREFIDRLKKDTKVSVSGRRDQRGVMLSVRCPFD